MKKIITKAIAATISMIIIVVLTLCLTSCIGQETWRIIPQKTTVEQQTFSLEMSVSQGIYPGERGTLEVTCYGEKLLKFGLANNQGETLTSFSYSNDTVTIGNGPSKLIIDANGIPRSYITETTCGKIDYGFTIDGEIKQIHITNGQRAEVFIEYTYGEKESTNLRWASFYPDMTNALSECKGLGEQLATIGTNRSGRIVDMITVKKLQQESKYIGEISVIREDSTRIKLESRRITTASAYGTPNQWLDKNVDCEKWYRLIK